ncbi:NAD(P)/FAD-dependent oxidoreductase [Primorskyibacter sp. S187A]|uniref:NAD(P)/FAD-dependent oxidoreductase n=1 Tax=Primorskyibacter sp. S187A TaxID=3415130 RepID=UPI003C7A6ED3
MQRVYEPWAYGQEPLNTCLWAVESPNLTLPSAQGDADTDIAIIGGGYTGLTAALHLARAGEGVTLLEAERIGWGASGRNGGFCCLGGGKISNAALVRAYGGEGRRAYRDAERAAVDHVEAMLDDEGIDVDRHSEGETLLAHTPRHWRALLSDVEALREDYGLAPELIPQDALRQHGMNGPFRGAMTLPIGFALNPRKYVHGLAQAALTAGAEIRESSPVTAIAYDGRRFTLQTPEARITARRIIIATNGYSSEDVPDWLRARVLPLQSNILATRPLSQAEQEAQGWTSAQMAYDTRHLLHYFRLLPDGRFLFGMRGGVFATPRATARLRRKMRADFHAMFPAWAEVEIPHMWSGLVCLARNRTPFVGEIPEMPGAFAGLAYHGNGVAMGSYAGRLLADLVRDRAPDGPYPAAFRDVPRKFPLGRYRRALLLAVNAGLQLADV